MFYLLTCGRRGWKYQRDNREREREKKEEKKEGRRKVFYRWRSFLKNIYIMCVTTKWSGHHRRKGAAQWFGSWRKDLRLKYQNLKKNGTKFLVYNCGSLSFFWFIIISFWSLCSLSAPQILPLSPFNSVFFSFVERISSLSSTKQTSDNNWQDERATPESISFLPLPSSCLSSLFPSSCLSLSLPLLFWVEKEICHPPDRMYHSSLFFFSFECIIVVLVEKREIEEKKHLTVAATKQNKKRANFLARRRKRLTTSLPDGQTLKPTFFCSRQKCTKNHVAKKNTRSGQFCGIRYWSLFGPERGERKDKEGGWSRFLLFDLLHEIFY